MQNRSLLLLAVALFACAEIVAADAVAQQQQVQAPPEVVGETDLLTRAAGQTAPVTLDGDTLFRVRGISSYPASQRAAAIAARIEALAQERDFSPEAIKVVETPASTNIMAGRSLVMGVFDADASVEGGLERQVLASLYVDRIRRAVAIYRLERSRPFLMAQALRGVVATAVAVLLAALIWWLGRWMEATVERRYRRRLQSVGIQSFHILEPAHIWSALLGALRAMRGAALLVLAYAYLHFVLSSFPWTKALARGLLGRVIDPLQTLALGALGHVPSLVFLLILVVLTRYLLKMVRLFFTAIEQGAVAPAGFDREWAAPTYRIIRLIVVAFAVVVAYPYIPGSGSAAFQGVSIFLGVLFSLGSSSVLSNIIAGYTMTYRRAFRVGDRIRVNDAVGDVMATRVMVTHLRSLKNEEIVIPNSIILNSQIVNYSSLERQHGLILHTTVGIGYEVPWRQVESMLRLAADRTPGLLKEPAPFVLQQSLGDFAVKYELNAYCDDTRRMQALYTDLHRHILDVFNEYGVQIMTPAYEGDPEQPKVVAKEQWHAAPAAFPAIESVPSSRTGADGTRSGGPT
jgi:small-conductance mechanosensitive channel